jgi:peptidoglycan/LPS O-acetylase OafA/YrhL
LGAVLASSQGLTVGRGGFLGISTALTISGFLLATLALAEWSNSGRLRLARFWERRARRLVPPVMLTVLGAVVLQATLRVGSGPSFRGDVLAALGFVTNWRLAYPAEGFARSFAEISALRHLWPVAITAQVFVLFPLVFMLLMWVTGRQWRIAGVLFGLGAAASFAAGWVMSDNPDARDLVSYGTHTRVGEVLVGVLLGYAVLSPAFRRLLSRPRVLSTVRYGAVAALGALGTLWLLTPPDSRWLFQGVTLANALLTAWIVLALTMPGPASSALGIWPLRRIGEISFAAYLLHWPLFLVLDEERLGVDGPLLFGIRVGATLLAALVLYWAVELPFRHQLQLPRRQLGMGLAGGTAVLAALVLVLPVNPPNGISLTVDDGNGPGDLDVVAPADGSEAARILVVGDEVAGSLVPGFQTWNERQTDRQVRIDTHVASDCPVGAPDRMVRLGATVGPSADCEAWRWRLPKTLDAADADAVIMVMGVADLGERTIDGESRHLGDATYDRWLTEEINGLADVLADHRVPVLWLTVPHVRLDDEDPSTHWPDFDDNDPRRVDRLNELIVGTIGDRAGFGVLDLDAFSHELPRGEFNPSYRSGATFTEPGATHAAAWLVPRVLSTLESAG